MIIMTRLFKVYISLSIIFVLNGCGKSFLDLAPISNASQSNFYQAIEDFELSVNAAYATLYTFYVLKSSFAYFTEQLSDNATLYNVSFIHSYRWSFKYYIVQCSNVLV